MNHAFFSSLKQPFPKGGQNRYQKKILALGVLSLIFFAAARYFPFDRGNRLMSEMREASLIMAEAMKAVRACQEEKGVSIDKNTDINATGLVGAEFSPLTTSLGNLEAKRTTTNPNFAALIVFLLNRAGVKRGDGVAIGASSSFPALVVASLSAARAIGVEPLVISSLGASQWGANKPDFHWLQMQGCLQRAHLFNVPPVALSLGGDSDTGQDMSPELRSLLLQAVRESGIPILHEPQLRLNVQERMRIYEEYAAGKKIKTFINIGGSLSNMGTDSGILNLRPGLTRVSTIPSPEKRGVIHEMALQKVPVIHLLFVKGLAKRYGLPWDPVPLPQPGEGGIYELARAHRTSFLIIAGMYILLVFLALFLKF